MIYSKADAAALVLEPVEKGHFSGNNPAGRLPIKMIFTEGGLIEINKFYKVKREARCCQEVGQLLVYKYRTWWRQI